MNLEEARKVLWLRNNPKPLGKLLEEGYLSRDRLEWAATHAYNPTLQEAAKVLLQAKPEPASKKKEDTKPLAGKNVERPVSIGITMEKARATPWPLPPLKGELMGALMDSKQLSLKDLVYAIENAWDERVRQAAIAFALMRLNQVVKEPIPSAGFVRLVSGGRSYAERKQALLTYLEGLVLGFLLCAMVLFAMLEIINMSIKHPGAPTFGEVVSTPSGIIALVIVVVGMFILLSLLTYVPDKLTKRLDKQIEEYRLGQEGEDRVIELIIQALDGNWSIFRNIGLPGRKQGDLDLVLVGPPGVWVLEVKNWRGKFRNIGDIWEYWWNKHWKAVPANPSRQALNNAYRLKNFLKAENLDVFVNGAVVWANQGSMLSVENPSQAVWLYDRLPDELGNIWQGRKLAEQDQKKIIEKLTKLCERQKKVN